jgi:hypothetical protein
MTKLESHRDFRFLHTQRALEKVRIAISLSCYTVSRARPNIRAFEK